MRDFFSKLMGKDSVATPSPGAAVAVREAPGRSAPEWAHREVKLPPWASVRCESSAVHRSCVVIDVDTDAAFTYWLALLEVPEADVDQYWIEVARQCVKLDIQLATAGSQWDPAVAGQCATIVLKRAPRWADVNWPDHHVSTWKHPDGREAVLTGAELASKGREAREHYRRIRGRLP